MVYNVRCVVGNVKLVLVQACLRYFSIVADVALSMEGIVTLQTLLCTRDSTSLRSRVPLFSTQSVFTNSVSHAPSSSNLSVCASVFAQACVRTAEAHSPASVLCVCVCL